ncbi:hypothetical protein CHUAL_009915 [Chamberlinius hualienensis]
MGSFNLTVKRKNHAVILQQANFPQGKALGGGSAINDMMYVRANKRDFDEWESLGIQSWSWNDVLPYYLKSEGTTIPWQTNDTTYHNVNGPVTLTEAPYRTQSLSRFMDSCVELGLPVTDTNGINQIGVSPISFTMKNGVRFSTVKAYINPAKKYPNLFISTNSEVYKVIFDNTKKAVGVELKKNGRKYVMKASKEVILSAGAVGTPKLLMLSGVGSASHLQQLNIPVVVDSPGVGQHLQDHVGCGHMIWKVNCSDCTYDVNQAMSLPSIFSWLLFRNGPITLAFANEGIAFLKSELANLTDSRPDIELQFVSANVASQPEETAKLLGISLPTLQKYYSSFSQAKGAFSIYPFLQHPKSVGSLKLQSSDYSQPTIIDFNYLNNSDDIKTLVEGVKAAYKIGNSVAFKSYDATFISTAYPGCENVAQFSDEYWECTCRHYTLATYHPVGSCKMGVDNMSVVNSKLQVNRVSNLRVIDASVMPTMVTGNIMATVIMIAEKAAAQLCNDYGYQC